MRFTNKLFVFSVIVGAFLILQAHADGRAGRDRDNTGAPGGQSGGGGRQITCNNCHENGALEVALNMSLLDENENPVETYVPNEVYTAKVTIDQVSGDEATGFGFQMVSLIDSDDSDVNGWDEVNHSSNVQLVTANSTGRVYAEHHSRSSSNEFTATWTAPETASGDVSFYVAGIGANSDGGSSGDHAPTPIKVTFSESTSASISTIGVELDIKVYPNPSSDILHIEDHLARKVIEIYQNGRLVQTVNSKSQETIISLSEMAVGPHMLLIKDDESNVVASRKLVKY